MLILILRLRLGLRLGLRLILRLGRKLGEQIIPVEKIIFVKLREKRLHASTSTTSTSTSLLLTLLPTSLPTSLPTRLFSDLGEQGGAGDGNGGAREEELVFVFLVVHVVDKSSSSILSTRPRVCHHRLGGCFAQYSLDHKPVSPPVPLHGVKQPSPSPTIVKPPKQLVVVKQNLIISNNNLFFSSSNLFFSSSHLFFSSSHLFPTHLFPTHLFPTHLFPHNISSYTPVVIIIRVLVLALLTHCNSTNSSGVSTPTRRFPGFVVSSVCVGFASGPASAGRAPP